MVRQRDPKKGVQDRDPTRRRSRPVGMVEDGESDAGLDASRSHGRPLCPPADIMIVPVRSPGQADRWVRASVLPFIFFLSSGSAVFRFPFHAYAPALCAPPPLHAYAPLSVSKSSRSCGRRSVPAGSRSVHPSTAPTLAGVSLVTARRVLVRLGSRGRTGVSDEQECPSVPVFF